MGKHSGDLMATLGEFLQGGQKRRQWLDQTIGDLMEYYTPPNLRPAAEFVAQMNPIQGMADSMQQGGIALDPSQTPEARKKAAMNSIVEGLIAVAPAAVAAKGYMTPAQGTMESLLGWSPAGQQIADDLGRFVADEAGNIRLWHGSPHDFDKFSMEHISTGEGAQDLGRGFSLTDSQGEAILYTNPASRWGDLAAMEKYRQAGPGRYYSVDVNANPEQFLDWNAPWRSQVQEGTPLFDKMLEQERRMMSIYGDDPAMVEAIPRAKFSRMWQDNAGFEDAAMQSGFVGNRRRNFSGDTEYTIFDPANLSIAEKFDVNGKPVLPTPRNDAEAMARDILDLRAAGRASEVTDDMMAKADPQYMFNNTPLDMSQEARMARAADMGFGGDWYHGTDADFAGFSLDKDRLDRGFWFGNQDVAGRFATAGDRGFYGGNVIPASTVSENPYIYDARNPSRPRSLGAIYDDAGSGDFTGVDFVGGRSEARTIFDPTNIRSRFARFDPAFKHLANLSAGVTLASLLGLEPRKDRQPSGSM